MLQKLLHHLRQKGITGTARYVISRSAERRREYLDRRFDRLYHTDTSGTIELAELNIDSANVKEGIWYEPVPTAVFRQLLGSLSVRHEDYTFVDYGSGKGRALLLASEFPFARVMGVEFSPQLHAAALKNFQAYRNPRQRCFHLESVCMDAADFEPPPEPCILFFYSPFKPVLLQQVVNRIMASLEQHPRSIYLVFYGANPDSIQVFLNTGLACREIKMRHDYTRAVTRRGLILHSDRAPRARTA